MKTANAAASVRLRAAALAVSAALLLPPGVARAEEAAAPAASPAPPADAKAAPAVSKATQLLFEGKHLAALEGGTVLAYRYDRRAYEPRPMGENYSDAIRLTIDAPQANGDRSVSVDMFTGARRVQAGPFPSMVGNPLLILFLETDVSAMQKLVGGNPRYLKNKIRAAFRAGGTVEPVKVKIGGVEHDAEKITLKPFADDTHVRELGAFVDKTYEFVVSDTVPGALVSLKTFTPRQDAPGEPYLEEEIHFAGTEPKKG